MEHQWNLLLISAERGLVRAFHCPNRPLDIAKSALATLKYVITEKQLERDDADVATLLELCNANLSMEKKFMACIDKNVEAKIDDELAVRFAERVLGVESYAFLGGDAKPEKSRNSIETAAWLAGVNPVANYMPFTERYNPPNRQQLIKLDQRCRVVAVRLTAKPLFARAVNREQAKERMQRFTDCYVAPYLEQLDN